MELPKISILTPTYDRKKFLPIMIHNIKNQIYPRNKLEWVILDSYSYTGKEARPLFDSDNEVSLLSSLLGIEIKYTYLHKTMSIGEKRNWLVKNAKYDHLINFDSDDLYFPNHIQYSLDFLKKGKYSLIGSPEMLFIFPNHEYKMSYIRCVENRQIHEASMLFSRKHFRKMNGFNTRGNGEGTKMVDGCQKKDFGKSDVRQQMVCICHDNNTCDKSRFLEDNFIIDANLSGDVIGLMKNIFSSSASPDISSLFLDD